MPPIVTLWSFSDSQVTWVQLALGVVSWYGFQQGWLSAEMSAVCLLVSVRATLNPKGVLITTASHRRSLDGFGLPNQSGFYLWFCLL